MSPRARRLARAAGCFLLFLLVAGLVGSGATIAFDRRMLAATRLPGPAHALLGPSWGLPVLIALTTFGAAIVRVPLALGAALLLLSARRGGEAALLAGAVAGGMIALPLIKALFDRARPDMLWRLASESRPSFPSGHAMGAMILYPLLGLAIARARGRSSHGFVRAGVGLALAIGATRVVLGVHWASDVLGGWLLGGGIALAAAALAGPERAPPHHC